MQNVPISLEDGSVVVEYLRLRQKLLPVGYQPRQDGTGPIAPVDLFVIAEGPGIDNEPVYWLRGLDDQGETVIGDLYYTIESAREGLFAEYGLQGASWIPMDRGTDHPG